METPFAARSWSAVLVMVLHFPAEAALLRLGGFLTPTSVPVSLRDLGAVSVTDGTWPPLRAADRESLAARTTASGVNPNSRNRVLASAEAPKCSMLMHRPASPTRSCHPMATPASTLTRARTRGGRTLSW